MAATLIGAPAVAADHSSVGSECIGEENPDFQDCAVVYMVNCGGPIGFVVVLGDGGSVNCEQGSTVCSGGVAWVVAIVGDNNEACVNSNGDEACNDSVIGVNLVVGDNNRACVAGQDYYDFLTSGRSASPESLGEAPPRGDITSFQASGGERVLGVVTVASSFGVAGDAVASY